MFKGIFGHNLINIALTQLHFTRKPGHPRTRWTESIYGFFCHAVQEGADQRFWMTLATDRDAWKALETDYASTFWGGGWTV